MHRDPMDAPQGAPVLAFLMEREVQPVLRSAALVVVAGAAASR